MTIQTVILAAGQGTRMRSRLPKVLHKIGGMPLLKHVYQLSQAVQCEDVFVIYGHGGEQVPSALPELDVHWTLQAEQLGTGHAVMQVASSIKDDNTVLILYGDVPLLTVETVNRLLAKVDAQSMGLLTVELNDPSGYGRIVRNQTGQVEAIVEEKDADESQKLTCEGNTGILAVNGGQLKTWLKRLDNQNAQAEYYLTDIIAMAVMDGMVVQTVTAQDENEVLGVNNRQQLAHLERVYQLRQANTLMAEGVTLFDPSRLDIRCTSMEIGQDSEIDVNVILEGNIRIGEGVRVGANTILKDVTIGDHVEILPNCVIEKAVIGDYCHIGPFARIRPDTHLGERVRIGNFVEIKKTSVDSESKINHLSYIGDSTVGARVNIGAGTITCNYDGANKHKTIIGDGAFIGSDTQLIAPVQVAKNATIGAGSTITRDTPENTLTLSRSKQTSIEGWARPVKKGESK